MALLSLVFRAVAVTLLFATIMMPVADHHASARLPESALRVEQTGRAPTPRHHHRYQRAEPTERVWRPGAPSADAEVSTEDAAAAGALVPLVPAAAPFGHPTPLLGTDWPAPRPAPRLVPIYAPAVAPPESWLDAPPVPPPLFAA